MNEQLVATIKKSEAYTMAVAETMPSAGYHGRLVKSNWNFAELIHHIGYGIEWLTDNYIVGKKTDWLPGDVPADKDEITRALSISYDRLATAVSAMNLTTEQTEGVHATLDHITHHRGQAVLYLRNEKLEPPAYTY